MGSIPAPEISMRPGTVPDLSAGSTPGQEAIRCSPRANTMATMTESLPYRHRIVPACAKLEKGSARQLVRNHEPVLALPQDP